MGFSPLPRVGPLYIMNVYLEGCRPAAAPIPTPLTFFFSWETLMLQHDAIISAAVPAEFRRMLRRRARRERRPLSALIREALMKCYSDNA